MYISNWTGKKWLGFWCGLRTSDVVYYQGSVSPSWLQKLVHRVTNGGGRRGTNHYNFLQQKRNTNPSHWKQNGRPLAALHLE